ncbi:hypothetical protein [Nocardia rhamnosiphila]|uniref:hypothetical protein n=1 Tax=Nocardia rhamnosiphila TaxID=426716 RepID=UPI0007A4FC7C|nr:hypothetical protein [Nocardia rhamnosiphila]
MATTPRIRVRKDGSTYSQVRYRINRDGKAVQTSAVGALVAAKARPIGSRTTAADFAKLAASLRRANDAALDETGASDRLAAETLAQLLAGAVLQAVAAEHNHEQQVDEIARLRAELDIERARADYTKTRLRRRIRHAHRSRAALRATITRTETAS